MRTRLGLAIKLWTEWFYIRASGDSAADTCIKLDDSLFDLDNQLLKLGQRLDAIEKRLAILEGVEPGVPAEESSI